MFGLDNDKDYEAKIRNINTEYNQRHLHATKI